MKDVVAAVLRGDYKIPIVADERVPPGMGVLGYDKDGKLVVAINLDKALTSSATAARVTLPTRRS